MRGEAAHSIVSRALPGPAAQTQTPEDFPVLTSVRLVCRECFSSLGIDALVDVVRLVDGFLDTFSGPDTVIRGCELGYSVRALTYLAARDIDSFWGKETTKWAAVRGHVHVLQWLNDNHPDRCEWTSTLDYAACGGHLSAVQWLHENRSEGCTTKAMDHAAYDGNLEILQWLHANRSEGCSGDAMGCAAMMGHLEVVKWLHKHYDNLSNGTAIRDAAENGFLSVVQWLYMKGGSKYRDFAEVGLQNAAVYEHLDVVNWLTKQRSKRSWLWRVVGSIKFRRAKR
ncbi:hypothetical protein BBJ28_00020380 [Nothophytophthora sp. Chile5]|nr:hypothetical protein BBJ28_00020380 [Nothophytophthora sp. Chile5]